MNKKRSDRIVSNLFALMQVYFQYVRAMLGKCNDCGIVKLVAVVELELLKLV